MGTHSNEWLANNVVVGHTDTRGFSWWYRKDLDTGPESNHYPGAIPIEAVKRRLFSWEALELPLNIEIPTDIEQAATINEAGLPIRYQRVPGRKAIVASDNHDVLGIFSDSYRPHPYEKWLLETVGTILDDNLSISSAGLLKNRAVAWTEIGMPNNITTPEGVVFRPNLLATTSFDGSLATTFKRTITAVICDNTHSIALAEKGGQLKIRHSRNSTMRIADARAALDIVNSAADDFSEQVKRLTNQTITNEQWAAIVDRLVPTDEDTSKRGNTMAAGKKAELNTLYYQDPRVTPWKGTAFAAYQAANTWNQHLMPVKGSTVRAERNMFDSISGNTESQDALIFAAIQGMDFGKDLVLAPLG